MGAKEEKMKKSLLVLVVVWFFVMIVSQSYSQSFYSNGEVYSINTFPIRVRIMLESGESWVRKAAAFYDSNPSKKQSYTSYTAAPKRTVYSFTKWFSTSSEVIQAESWEIVWDNGKLAYIKFSILNKNGEWEARKFFP